MHLRVPPGKNLIIIMQRTDREASYQVTYYCAVVFPEEDYLKALKCLVRGQPEKDLKRIKDTMGIIPSQHVRMQQIQY